MTVRIRFSSLKAPKIDSTIAALPSQTFLALKTRLAEDLGLNASSLRFLFKNKAVSDSKSVRELFGDQKEGQITVMVMKGATPSKASTSTSENQPEANMAIDNDDFWDSIRVVITDKYKGGQGKDEVFTALKKGYEDKFGNVL
jgi:hypothetical protein